MTETHGWALPVFGIAGYKNSGKTTLAVALIAEFRARGLRVATVKHAHHQFRIDDDETDSARHRRAGAAQVAIVSSQRWALVTENDDGPEPALAEMVARLAAHRPRHDLVLVEGYKAEPIPKIECRRSLTRRDPPLADRDPSILALCTDHPVTDAKLPVLDINDIGTIADFILQTLGLAEMKADNRTRADRGPSD